MNRSLRKDRLIKARLYGRVAVDEYWIVNLVEGVVEVHREPGPEGWGSIARYGRGELLRLQAYPDVAVAVAEILPPT